MAAEGLASLNGAYALLVLGGGLLAVALVLGVLGARLGISHLLVFLLVGMAAGVDGLGLRFADHGFAFIVGNLALAVILLEGGLQMRLTQLRAVALPAVALSTLGVVITIGLVAALAMVWLKFDWRYAALLGAIVASTDAAAVFAQLGQSGVKLPQRLSATIEAESGLNDPLVVCLTLVLIELIRRSGAEVSLAALVGQHLGLGALAGVVAGAAAGLGLRRLPLDPAHAGLMALLLAACGTVLFAATSMAGGSGFLAVYLFGVAVGRLAPRRVAAATAALKGYTGLAEALMFLLLGLLITPHEVLRYAVPGLVIAAGLMVVARPLAVVACLAPCSFTWREQAFVAVVGLRGAVPIVLALYPVLAGVPQAFLLLDIAFIVVLCSLLIQAPLLGPLARRLGLAG